MRGRASAASDGGAGTVAADSEEAEIRFDPNCPRGKSYTKAQFIVAYGGTGHWDTCFGPRKRRRAGGAAEAEADFRNAPTSHARTSRRGQVAEEAARKKLHRMATGAVNLHSPTLSLWNVFQ